MATSTLKPSRRTKLLATLVLLMIGVALCVSLVLNQERREVRSPEGNIIRLEDYAFSARTVRYEVPNRPVARVLAKVLPDAARKEIKWLKPEMAIVVTPPLPREPYLSAAFSGQRPSGEKLSRPGTRLVVANEQDQMYDSVVNCLADGSALEVAAFPRRGKELRLRLMSGEKAVAEFKIRNPCPGPHPVWKANPLPLTVTNKGLEITLEKFTADSVRRRTRCVFRVRENGTESTGWLPAGFEISDATGNHWKPINDKPQSTNSCVLGSFLGALWPGEEAWKVRVQFKAAGKQATNQTPFSVEFLAKPEQGRGF